MKCCELRSTLYERKSKGENHSRKTMAWHRKKHVRLFTQELRDHLWERRWADRNEVPLSEASYAIPDTFTPPA